MTEINSGFIGKKFACPGCQSKLKFTRAPKSLLQKCPNCRRKIRLQEKQDAADDDDLVRQAIESLVDWNVPDKKIYNYWTDPLLDRVDDSQEGIWKFDQPWPKRTGDVLMERVQVVFGLHDVDGKAKSRQRLLDGTFRRITAVRTGQVEEVDVIGHWWEVQHCESKLGLLSRSVVRELNLNPSAKRFCVRINCLEFVMREDKQLLDLYIDIAIDETVERRQRRY